MRHLEGYTMASETKRCDKEMTHIDTTEQAVQWCSDESADVEFSNNVGVRRVWVRVSGHPVVVRETLIEAVNVLNDMIRKRKSDECLYIW
jgi:chorismate-pyruvate lyase